MRSARANVKKLKAIMEKNELTAFDVAKKIDKHPVTVRRYLCGMKPIPNSVITLLNLLLQQQ